MNDVLGYFFAAIAIGLTLWQVRTMVSSKRQGYKQDIADKIVMLLAAEYVDIERLAWVGTVHDLRRNEVHPGLRAAVWAFISAVPRVEYRDILNSVTHHSRTSRILLDVTINESHGALGSCIVIQLSDTTTFTDYEFQITLPAGRFVVGETAVSSGLQSKLYCVRLPPP